MDRTRRMLMLLLTTLTFACEPGGGAPTLQNDLPYAIVVVDHYGERHSGHSIARILQPGEAVTPSWVYTPSADGYFVIKGYRAGSLADGGQNSVSDLSMLDGLETVFCRKFFTRDLKAAERPVVSIDQPLLNC
jgi:hypothetical protein